MKKLNLWVMAFAMLPALSSFSQDDLAIELITPASGSIINPTSPSIDLQFEIKNVGTTTISQGDTLIYSLLIDGVVYNFNGVQNNVNGTFAFLDINPNMSITLPVVNLDLTNLPISNISSEVCMVLWGNGLDSYFLSNGPDDLYNEANSSNNKDCFIIGTPSSINEVSEDQNIRITRFDDQLEIHSDKAGIKSYKLISITGKIIAEGSIETFKSIDISGLKGIYTLQVNDNQTVFTEKLMFQ